MTLTVPQLTASGRQAQPIPLSDLDGILAAQFVVAWAGEEGGDEPRLGWWRSDLISEFGGMDLFKRLMPHTWEWAVLQGAREAARRRDGELRAQDHNPDRLLSLFNLGFELDERLEERLRELKQPDPEGTVPSPRAALPGLNEVLAEAWSTESFFDWVSGHGEVEFTPVPVGRQLNGETPAGAGHLVRKLVAALAPASDRYPLPHFRRKV